VKWDALRRSDKRRFEELSFTELSGLVATGELLPNDLARRTGEQRWRPIADINELAELLPRFTLPRKVSGGEDAETMDMTPMIDVVFQLLLFFMIISTFQVQKSIAVPQTESEKQTDEAPAIGQLGREMVVVHIDEQSNIYFVTFNADGQIVEREEVNRQELVDKFRDIATEQLKNKVLIDAHDLAELSVVVAVIDAAKQAQMEDVSIARRVNSTEGQLFESAQ